MGETLFISQQINLTLQIFISHKAYTPLSTMFRIIFFAVIAFVSIANIDSFTYQIQSSQKTFISEPLFMASNDDEPGKFVERGVSYDQDGKSNVWAIEPKMELESKSKEE